MSVRTAAGTRAEIAAADERLAELDPDCQSHVDLSAWRDDLYGELFATRAELTPHLIPTMSGATPWSLMMALTARNRRPLAWTLRILTLLAVAVVIVILA